MLKTPVSLLLSTLIAGSAIGQCFTVTSTSAGGNGQNGTMFNVVNVSATAQNIGTFDQAFLAAGTSNVFIYTKAGTFLGSESTPGAWTLVGSNPAVVHGVFPAIDPVPIPVGVTIAPAATQAFYITCDTTLSPNVAYTTGVGQLGAVIASNADLQVIGGVGKSYPFGSTFGAPTAGRLWIGRVNYCPTGTGTVLATNTTLGVGCIRKYTSFYEFFPNPPTGFDLSNTSHTYNPAGSGYVVTSGGAFIPVGTTSTPVVIAIGDDVEQTVTLAAMGPFPTPTGPAASLVVCSNGFVSTAVGNGTNWVPSSAAHLNAPQTSWRCWHDYANQLGGSVKFEESASVSVITWDNVRNYGGTSALDDSTLQMQFYPSGAVTFAFLTMSTATNPSLGAGGAYLVGYSPGGNSADPGSVDISAVLATGAIITDASDVLPLTLAATSRPITNTNWNLTVSNIPATAAFGLNIFGVADPGINDLFFLGMPGCPLRSSLDVIQGPWIPAATYNYSFAIPNSPAVLNFHLFTTAAVYLVPTQNAFGFITSNGIDGKIGDF